MSNRLIPRRRVQALRGGTLLFNRRIGTLAPVDDDWWEGLLDDPRARPKTYGAQKYRDRLDQLKEPFVHYACQVCGWEKAYIRKELMDSWGGHTDALELGRRLADCRYGKRDGPCSVRCVRR